MSNSNPVKEQLIDSVIEPLIVEQAEESNNSKVIDGQRRFHHLFVMGVERFKSQLADIPLHELQRQVEAGSFDFCDN
jgi:hypothetical protein